MIKRRYFIIQYLFDGDWENLLMWIERIFIDLYEWAATCLFVLVTALASISLQVITEEVKNPLPPIGNSAKTQLKKWGQNYSHIFIFNQQINKCFGMFLLITILKEMIIIQYTIFATKDKMLSSDRLGFPFFLFLRLFHEILPCLIICYASQNMKNKVFGNSNDRSYFRASTRQQIAQHRRCSLLDLYFLHNAIRINDYKWSIYHFSFALLLEEPGLKMKLI